MFENIVRTKSGQVEYDSITTQSIPDSTVIYSRTKSSLVVAGTSHHEDLIQWNRRQHRKDTPKFESDAEHPATSCG